MIRAYWSLRSLMAIRWLVEHGYGAPATFPEVAVLRSGTVRPRSIPAQDPLTTGRERGPIGLR